MTSNQKFILLIVIIISAVAIICVKIAKTPPKGVLVTEITRTPIKKEPVVKNPLQAANEALQEANRRGLKGDEFDKFMKSKGVYTQRYDPTEYNKRVAEMNGETSGDPMLVIFTSVLIVGVLGLITYGIVKRVK